MFLPKTSDVFFENKACFYAVFRENAFDENAVVSARNNNFFLRARLEFRFFWIYTLIAVSLREGFKDLIYKKRLL